MADMLRDGLAHLTRTLKASASQQVRYSRGPYSAVVAATFSPKLLKVSDLDGGTRMEWTDMDFTISASELVLDGETIIPDRGDILYVGIGTDTEAYQVMPFGSDPAWRWCDPYQLRVRVHTKHIDTEDDTEVVG